MREILFTLLGFCIGLVTGLVLAVVAGGASECQHKHDENKDDCDP